jgi:hypothetical protein
MPAGRFFSLSSPEGSCLVLPGSLGDLGASAVSISNLVIFGHVWSSLVISGKTETYVLRLLRLFALINFDLCSSVAKNEKR